jgi:hypothetical protein
MTPQDDLAAFRGILTAFILGAILWAAMYMAGMWIGTP